jgi:hypothetical protein
VTPDNKLAALERAFEARMIDLMKATDGAGLKIMLTPHRPITPGVNPLTVPGSGIPMPEDFVKQINTLMCKVGDVHIAYRGEEALARNIGLLAAAWEAAVRYWDFKKEVAK